eukprot:TRINITY_DN2859_c0_g1_i2.p1 TRINITY_DN2859_c0_g1~~TRINITY_DN2859_c0_g1_i2.p1  ORF type:complete len:989 (-),score=202.46 TRINITY_DN2859_c0_g1_i2:533-3499(-)
MELYNGNQVTKAEKPSNQVVEEKKVLGMSLSSTLSASLDLGDLSSVWNRAAATTSFEGGVSKELADAFRRDKWLQFLDPQLEEEFVEKFFYASIKTHRAFCLIVPAIYALFIIWALITYATLEVFILHHILGLGTFSIYFYSKSKNFRNQQHRIMIAMIIYNALGLSLQRQYMSREDPGPGVLSINDARGLMVIHLFCLYAAFLSLRFTMKTVLKVTLTIIVIYFVNISLFGNLTGYDFLFGFVCFFISYATMGVSAYSTELRHRNQEVQRAGILKNTEEVAREKVITEKLLLNILPMKIARRLMSSDEIISDGYPSATVLFADLVGWTAISQSMTPTESIQLLGEIVTNIDRLTKVHKVEKIKTIGDAYLVACGLPDPLTPEESTRIMANFALDLMRIMKSLSESKKRTLDFTLGIHTGPVVAGVIGKTKFLYDLWGDSVNTASRMQSHGEAGKIHVTSAVYDLIKEDYDFEKRPIINVKGKGDMQTYYLLSWLHKNTQKYTTVEDLSRLDATQSTQVESSDEPLEHQDQEEVDISRNRHESKDERRARKAKEARQKRNAEIDEQLDKQIKTKRGILSFTDASQEEEFRMVQDQDCSKHMVIFTMCLIAYELIVGLDVFNFNVDDVPLYYMAMCICVPVQVATIYVARSTNRGTSGLSLFNLIIFHLCNIVLFVIYRMRGTYSTRSIFFQSSLTSVVALMSSKIPYRRIRSVIWTTWFILMAAQVFVNGKLGLDVTNGLLYLCLTIFGHETAKHVEKHARREYLLSNLANEERARVIKQREESERLLYNILPESVIRKMRESEGKIIDIYANSSIMFADIVGFTVLSSKLDARSIVSMLNSMFSQVDEVAERKGLEKIKTIGDAYMVAAGLPYPRPDHAKIAVEMALEMVKIVQALEPIEGLRVNVRIGVHSGTVVGGIIGSSKMVRLSPIIREKLNLKRHFVLSTLAPLEGMNFLTIVSMASWVICLLLVKFYNHTLVSEEKGNFT